MKIESLSLQVYNAPIFLKGLESHALARPTDRETQLRFPKSSQREVKNSSMLVKDIF